MYSSKKMCTRHFSCLNTFKFQKQKYTLKFLLVLGLFVFHIIFDNTHMLSSIKEVCMLRRPLDCAIWKGTIFVIEGTNVGLRKTGRIDANASRPTTHGRAERAECMTEVFIFSRRLYPCRILRRWRRYTRRCLIFYRRRHWRHRSDHPRHSRT